MSMQFRSCGKLCHEIDWSAEPGRTAQEFKDECDINILVKKAVRMGMSLEEYQNATDFVVSVPDMDYKEAMDHLVAARQVFESLPPSIVTGKPIYLYHIHP